MRIVFAWIVAFALCGFPVLANAAQSAFPAPVVVVYPFTLAGSMSSPQAGNNLAILFSNRLQTLGGVTVVPYTPGTERHDFLTAAQKQNADYYVTGFLTPIGGEVSLITQAVSIYGGTVIWSSTVTIRTYADALAQVDDLHAAIVAHAGRSLASLGAQPPATTPPPTSNDAAGLNLTRALGRHKKAAAVPSPTGSASPQAAAVASAPKAAAPAPAAALVANVGGGADSALRAYASTSLAAALRSDGITHGGGIAVASADVPGRAADLCKTNGPSTLYGSTLDVDASRDVALNVSAYDCTGKTIGTQHVVAAAGKRGSLQRAIDRASAQAIDAFAKAARAAR